MAIVEGFAAELSIVREATFNGSASGTPLILRGKVGFTYQPLLERGNIRTNVWRLPASDSFTVKHWQGTVSSTYSHDSAIFVFLESLLGLYSTQNDTPSVGLTTYSLRPGRTEVRKSLKIGLAYRPDTEDDPEPLNCIFAGVMVESIQLVLRNRELLKWKVGFRAVSFTTGSKLTPTQNASQPLRAIDASVLLDGVTQDNAFELTCNLDAPVTPAQFNRSGTATKLSNEGPFTFHGELVEYFADDIIAGKARALTEAALQVDVLVPGTSKKISLIWPRVVFRSGNPEGLSGADLVSRATFEGMHDDAIGGTEPRLIAVI